jgi:hypothetical protein
LVRITKETSPTGNKAKSDASGDECLRAYTNASKINK